MRFREVRENPERRIESGLSYTNLLSEEERMRRAEESITRKFMRLAYDLPDQIGEDESSKRAAESIARKIMTLPDQI